MGRYVSGHIPPLALAQWRWTIAFFILLPFGYKYLRKDWRLILRSWKSLTVLSISGITLYNSMAYIGLTQTKALNALLLNSTMPLWIAGWTFVLFREKLMRAQMWGILISLIGVMTILLKGDLQKLSEMSFNVGDIWIIGALIVYALYSALIRNRPAIHWMSFLTITIGVGAILHLPFYLWEKSNGAVMVLDMETLLAIAYVSTLPSILAYIFYIRGIELIGANRAGVLYHLMPMFGSVLAIGLLGETPAIYHAIGYSLIICGIIASQRTRHKTSNSTG